MRLKRGVNCLYLREGAMQIENLKIFRELINIIDDWEEMGKGQIISKT